MKYPIMVETTLTKFSLIIGGGKFGTKAAKYLLKNSKPFIVLDKDEKCLVTKTFNLTKLNLNDITHMDSSKNYFAKGNVIKALTLIEKIKPEYVFPTAPIHIAAMLVKEKYSFKVWDQGINHFLAGIPPKIIVSVGKGTVVVSYNRDKPCKQNCDAPPICPVTKLKKPCPMYDLLQFAAPEAIILRSYQLEPGLGALKGNEIIKVLEKCKGKSSVIIGTACKCHGVITALRAPER